MHTNDCVFGTEFVFKYFLRPCLRVVEWDIFRGIPEFGCSFISTTYIEKNHNRIPSMYVKPAVFYYIKVCIINSCLSGHIFVANKLWSFLLFPRF